MFSKTSSAMLAALFLFGLMGCHNNFTAISVSGSDSTVFKKPQPVADKFDWQPISYDTAKRYIYLTFDDGPQNGTVNCFELCKKLGVKATFFMVGQHANSFATKKIVADIHDAYPQMLLSNHSSTHANGHYKYFYQHPQMAEEDFFKAQQTLHVPYKIVRLPGNSAWVRNSVEKASGLVKPVCNLLDSASYNVIGWDVEWSFNHKNANPVQSPQKMVNIIDSALAKEKLHTKKHLVILTHDRMFRSANYTDSLAKFIILLKQDPRNVFETIDHYPGVKIPNKHNEKTPAENAVAAVQNLTKKQKAL